MRTLNWYFDFVSPYAYLQSARLEEFAEHVLVRCHPVLFAGMLQHHGHKGPAEIASKRRFTYEHVTWLAQRNNIPLTWPAHHPFNPLPLLRLAILLDAPIDVVRRLFAFVWRDGHLPDDPVAWHALLEELKVAPEELDAPEVKEALREDTRTAIEAGVFGVPTVELDGQLIWGFEATDMVRAKIAEDAFFDSPAIVAARSVPAGVQRRT
ncbi:MAG TPA: DsbA family protein [Quisquiliibacterium sp.]|nr:DsbA family protein [Quisquiliibacterium sp.]